MGGARKRHVMRMRGFTERNADLATPHNYVITRGIFVLAVLLLQARTSASLNRA